MKGSQGYCKSKISGWLRSEVLYQQSTEQQGVADGKEWELSNNCRLI